MPFTRCQRNPILTREDIPDLPPRIRNPSAVFNPGAVKTGEIYRLLLRVQTRGRETHLLMAESRDGERFEVIPRVVEMEGLSGLSETVYHVYDPRLTWIENRCVIVLALDVPGACRLGLAETRDFEHFTFLGLVSGDDSRNGVLFPERIGGRYRMLERPNTVMQGGAAITGSAIALAESEDLRTWRRIGTLLTGRLHYWDEFIGPGAPPVKTREGWLCVYHGIATHPGSPNIYQAGVFLLDLENPLEVKARGRNNVLEPREMYEMVGQVPNVVFPSGMIVEETDAEGYARPGSLVRLYYGAADTCVALATTTIAELIAACDD